MKKKVVCPSSIYWDFRRDYPVFSFVIRFFTVLFMSALLYLAFKVVIS